MSMTDASHSQKDPTPVLHQPVFLASFAIIFLQFSLPIYGKALGASGGYVCGSRALIDLLVNRARSFIFSTAPVPAAAAAASAAIKLIQSAEGASLNERLWACVEELNTAIGPPPSPIKSAIRPILIGNEAAAVSAADALREQGIFAPAIRYPTVARGQARLRISISAAHTAEDVAALARALSPIINRNS